MEWLIWIILTIILMFFDEDLGMFSLVMGFIICLIASILYDTDYIQDHAIQFEEAVPINFQFTEFIQVRRDPGNCASHKIITDKGVACAYDKVIPIDENLEPLLVETSSHINSCPAMDIAITDRNPDYEYLVMDIRAEVDEYYPEQISNCVKLAIENANTLFERNAYVVSLSESERKKAAWEGVPTIQHPAPNLSDKLENSNDD